MQFEPTDFGMQYTSIESGEASAKNGGDQDIQINLEVLEKPRKRKSFSSFNPFEDVNMTDDSSQKADPKNSMLPEQRPLYKCLYSPSEAPLGFQSDQGGGNV